MDNSNSLRALAERALPFLREASEPFDDDGGNEPLELARAIECALEKLPGVAEVELDIYKLAEQCGGDIDGGEYPTREHPGSPSTVTLTESQLEDFVRTLRAAWRPVPDGLIDRIKAAEQRIQNNHAPRRIPADSTDVDLVLAEVRLWLEGKPAPFWLGAAKQEDQRND